MSSDLAAHDAAFGVERVDRDLDAVAPGAVDSRRIAGQARGHADLIDVLGLRLARAAANRGRQYQGRERKLGKPANRVVKLRHESSPCAVPCVVGLLAALCAVLTRTIAV